MTEQNTLTEVIRAIIKWRKAIVIITLITAIGSSIIAFLLPVYYKSTEIFYPYKLESLDPKNILTEEIAEVFGTNSDVERLKQIGVSSQLIGYMVYKFNLYQKYNIDPNDKLGNYEVSEEFKENYNIIKNDMGALEVSIMDKDPNMASVMASEAVRFIDSINRQSIIDNNVKLYTVLKSSLDDKFSELEQVEGRINKAGVDQSGLSKALTPKSMIETGKINDMNSKLMEKLTQAIETKEKFSTIKGFLQTNFNTIFVIEKAAPAIKKAKPVRWLIVTSSTFLAFFLMLIAVMSIEYYRNHLREIINNAK